MDRPIIFSGQMVRALLAGRKTQTRRLATSPLRRCAVGDRLYVREAWAVNEGTAGGCLYRADHGGADSVTTYDLKAGGEPLVHISRWRPSIHMPCSLSRLTLTVKSMKVELLQAISTLDVLAEGAPLDPNHRDGTQDGSNPFMCVGDRPWTSQSPHAWYHRLWDSLHDKPGERWDDNPHVVALTFRVEHCNIDRLAA